MKKWIVAIRAPFFTASVAPALVGVAVAFYEGYAVHWWHAALTLVGLLAIHGGTNLANDYFDHVTRDDWVNVTPTPFSGGSRVIQEGVISPRAIFIYSLACFAVGIACGLYLWRVTPGNVVLWLGLVGVASGSLYTAVPVAIGYRGVGELFVGLNFGPLAVLGTHYVQAGHLSPTALMASVPVGLLIAAVLYVNEFPDYEADKQVNKKTLIVIFGPERARYGYVILIALTYAAVAAFVAFGGLPAWALLGLLTLPLAAKAATVLMRHYREPYQLIPANVLTIVVHFGTGILLSVGLALGRAA
ncbi:MAG: 1,4-dihydroxy-2-naphthoate octaprenyltransferase [candidate division Zixibacteria bacterium]|nr:1,4-dihydroxy-2-naphthoate octaprenyltransferase [candidate division Zixibacteria bacterium]